MKHRCRCLLLAATMMLQVQNLVAQLPYQDARLPIDTRVNDLLSRMTTEEKVGQLRCLMGWEMYRKTGTDEVVASEQFRLSQSDDCPAGAYWAVLRADPWTQKTLLNGLNPRLAARTLNTLQREAIAKSRLGIPLLFVEECPHGHMAIGTTVFPTGIALASTFDVPLLERIGHAIGTEARAQGAGMALGPVVDLGRDPRWSRVEEGLGADSHLSATLGEALTHGLEAHLPACLKHFAAYGSGRGGHNGAAAELGPRALLSDYLVPFEKAVAGGAHSLMTSYNAIDGVPASSNAWLLRDVLRKAWGFRGVVISDLFALDGLVGTHRVCGSKVQAAALALQSGVDIDLGGQVFAQPLLQALREAQVDEAVLDSAASHVLRLKFELGLFENPFVDENTAAQVVGSSVHRDLALQAAREGVVLLENNGILPLKKNLRRIAVIGPNADTPYNQLGDYTAPQPEGKIITPLKGIRAAVGSRTRVDYVRGCGVRDTLHNDIAAAAEAARAADVAIVVVGGSSGRDFRTSYEDTGAASATENDTGALPDMDCGEGYDRATLSLLGLQDALLDAVMQTGTPTVVVYVEGRPLLKESVAQKAAAVLTAWYPGQEGGRALAEILFGDVNPSGRLPFDVPRSVGQLPLHYAEGYGAPYIDAPSTPRYAFGFGKSFTTFAYSDLRVEGTAADADTLTVGVEVHNTGRLDGTDVVQLYVRNEAATVLTPQKQLKAFARIALKSGEKQRVEMKIAKRDLEYVDTSLKRKFARGKYVLMLGGSSDNLPLQTRVEIE